MIYQQYGIYFQTDRQNVRLPVNPSEVSVKYDGDSTSYNLIDLGEVIIPRNPKLATVEINSFFPRNSFLAGTAMDSWYQPAFYVEFFQMLQRKKTVFQFIINRFDGDSLDGLFDSSFKAIITSFEVTDKGGESGDVYFSLTVSEYRNTEPQKVEVISIDINNDVTYLAQTKQREVPNDEIVVGDPVTVTGPVYQTDDEDETAYQTSRRAVTNYAAKVGRVLPPSLTPQLNRIYLVGLGWVQRTDCIKGNVNNTIQRVGINNNGNS